MSLMASLSGVINVNVDPELKKEATAILKGLGLNMSTLINMTLAQVVKRNGVPFEVSNPKPSKELIKALKEADKIIEDIKSGKRKSYHNIDELFEDLDNGI